MKIINDIFNIRNIISSWDLKHNEMPTPDHFMNQLPIEYRHNDVIRGLFIALISERLDNYWGAAHDTANLKRHEEAVAKLLKDEQADLDVDVDHLLAQDEPEEEHIPEIEDNPVEIDLNDLDDYEF